MVSRGGLCGFLPLSELAGSDENLANIFFYIIYIYHLMLLVCLFDICTYVL